MSSSSDVLYNAQTKSFCHRILYYLWVRLVKDMYNSFSFTVWLVPSSQSKDGVTNAYFKYTEHENAV
jgi:hypothetical protein